MCVRIICVCVCLCVCVRKGERESVCVCVRVYVAGKNSGVAEGVKNEKEKKIISLECCCAAPKGGFVVRCAIF